MARDIGFLAKIIVKEEREIKEDGESIKEKRKKGEKKIQENGQIKGVSSKKWVIM